MSFRQTFQVLSYLQYPLMALGLFFSVKPYFKGFEYLAENPNIVFVNYNYALIFMGLGISFSTLQDTSKMQNEFSRKIWKNPKKGKIVILIICGLVLECLIFGIGLIGFLKTALEAFENHREDRIPANQS